MSDPALSRECLSSCWAERSCVIQAGSSGNEGAQGAAAAIVQSGHFEAAGGVVKCGVEF